MALLDPGNRPLNNPYITVDFRAFLQATGGLNAAEKHFRTCKDSFGICYPDRRFCENQVRVEMRSFPPEFG